MATNQQLPVDETSTGIQASVHSQSHSLRTVFHSFTYLGSRFRQGASDNGHVRRRFLQKRAPFQYACDAIAAGEMNGRIERQAKSAESHPSVANSEGQRGEAMEVLSLILSALVFSHCLPLPRFRHGASYATAKRNIVFRLQGCSYCKPLRATRSPPERTPAIRDNMTLTYKYCPKNSNNETHHWKSMLRIHELPDQKIQTALDTTFYRTPNGTYHLPPPSQQARGPHVQSSNHSLYDKVPINWACKPPQAPILTRGSHPACGSSPLDHLSSQNVAPLPSAASASSQICR